MNVTGSPIAQTDPEVQDAEMARKARIAVTLKSPTVIEIKALQSSDDPKATSDFIRRREELVRSLARARERGPISARG